MARVAPLGQRIVETHPQTFFAYGIGQFGNDVAPRAANGAVPLGLLLTVPQAVAVVVLCDKQHVFGTSLLEQPRPFAGLPKFAAPMFCQRCILLKNRLRGVGI